MPHLISISSVPLVIDETTCSKNKDESDVDEPLSSEGQHVTIKYNNNYLRRHNL
jgi:hypothetical protein